MDADTDEPQANGTMLAEVQETPEPQSHTIL